MKNLFYISILSFGAFASDSTSTLDKNYIIFKTGLLSLSSYGNFGLSYQRSLNEKSAIRATVSFAYSQMNLGDTTSYKYDSTTISRNDAYKAKTENLLFSLQYLRNIKVIRNTSLYIGGGGLGIHSYYTENGTNNSLKRKRDYYTLGIELLIGAKWKLMDNLNLHADLPIQIGKREESSSDYNSSNDYSYRGYDGLFIDMLTCQLGISYSF